MAVEFWGEPEERDVETTSSTTTIKVKQGGSFYDGQKWFGNTAPNFDFLFFKKPLQNYWTAFGWDAVHSELYPILRRDSDAIGVVATIGSISSDYTDQIHSTTAHFECGGYDATLLGNFRQLYIGKTNIETHPIYNMQYNSVIVIPEIGYVTSDSATTINYTGVNDYFANYSQYKIRTIRLKYRGRNFENNRCYNSAQLGACLNGTIQNLGVRIGTSRTDIIPFLGPRTVLFGCSRANGMQAWDLGSFPDTTDNNYMNKEQTWGYTSGFYNYDYATNLTWYTYNSSGKIYHMPNAVLTVEQVREMLAYLGFIWSEQKPPSSSTAAITINLDDETTFFPEIVNGVLTGNYTHGAENENNPYYSEGDPADNRPFENDPNTYTDETELTTPTLNATGVFNRCFAVNAGNVNNLSDWLYNADESVFDEIIAGLGLQGANPINGIIDLRLYPFDVASVFGSGAAENIKIGRTASPVQGILIPENASAIIDLGSCEFYKYFKNFLDDEPFTTGELYLPYCGKIQIPTAVFSGKIISVKMIVDLVTGACCDIVFCNGIAYAYSNGVCGISIPITGTDSAQYASNVLNSFINSASNIVGGVAGTATGNPAGVVNIAKGVAGFAAAPVENVPFVSASASSPSCSLYYPQYPYFIVYTPKTEIPENYGHTVGYACSKSGVLSGFTGFTVAVNPDIDTIACTETEKEEITNLLAGGIYL